MSAIGITKGRLGIQKSRMLKGGDSSVAVDFQYRYVDVRFQGGPELEEVVCGWMCFASFLL